MHVVVVGAGFAGIGASVALASAGIDHVVLERGGSVGGTWRDNRYPGCRCDVPSNLYSFSFALSPDWSETYSPQPEIEQYLRDVADRFGVTARTRFGVDVRSAQWTGAGWELDTTDGPIEADVVLLGNGPLAEPRRPDIPGLDSFAGAMFHTARWPSTVDLAGKRVGVIGTGSSAVQLVPEIQPDVGHLTVFQRTPPWVIPHRTEPVSARRRRVYRMLPIVQRAQRARTYWQLELIGLAMVHNRTGALERLARAHLAAQVADPSMRASLTPNYRAGCKRLLLSDDWYPAIQQPNVAVVGDRIIEVVPDGVVTADGRTHELDTVILGTGFRVVDNPMYDRVVGVDGRTLAARWNDDGRGARAYLGATVPGFPNLFLLGGPNTGIGHTSLVFMIESQLRYVLDALRTMREVGVANVDVRTDVYDSWADTMTRRSRRTVWAAGGCTSWYLDADGDNGAIWPDLTFRFRLRTRRFDASSYELGSPLPVTTKVPVHGAELAVTDLGAGPPIVLAPGWTEQRDVWAPVARRLLAEGRRVVVYDQRGQGASSGETGFSIESLGADLRAVLEAVDARDAVLAGHSMGGMAALSLALHHPDVLAERVDRLVLVSTGAAELARGDRDDAAARVLTARSVDRLMRTRWGHQFTRHTFGRRPTPASLRLMRDMFVTAPPAARAGWIRALWRMDLRAGLAGITIPTVVVCGTRDRVTPPRLSRALVADIPGARLVSLPDRGHQLPIEAPDDLVAVLLDRER